MRLLILLAVVTGAPEVALPEKEDVALPVGSRDVADAVRAGVKAARADLDRCRLRDGGAGCTCAVLKKVRFDVALDGGTVTVTYPLVAHTGPSFTIDASGRVIDCR
ncbi:MAG: hypothetical protein ABTQ32_07825 [Myxococcaceae bacterium]